jgi:hypothetical protein
MKQSNTIEKSKEELNLDYVLYIQAPFLKCHQEN